MIHKYASLTWISSTQVKSRNPVFPKSTQECSNMNLSSPRWTLLFLVLKSPLYYTNRAINITVFSDTLIHNIGYIFEHLILTLIFRLDTKLHCLFLQITSEMTNKKLSILLIDNLFFGFNAYKSYSLKLISMKLASCFIT